MTKFNYKESCFRFIIPKFLRFNSYLILIFLSVLHIGVHAQVCSAGPSPNCIGGNVFEDFNCNGIEDTKEAGVLDVVVEVYDCDNVLVGTADTDDDGEFQICGLTDGDEYRVEFLLPTDVDVWANPTHNGSDNSTDVQFHASPACTKYSVSNPFDFCEDNPLMVLPCFLSGDPLAGGTSAGEPAIVTVDYAGTVETVVGLTDEVGSVWGIAQQGADPEVYSSAVLKRHVGYGPQGPGGIYVTDLATGTTTSFIDVAALGVNVGTDPRNPADPANSLPANFNQPSQDSLAFFLFGYMGIGDLDVSDDGNTMYLTNLNDGMIYIIDISSGNPTVGDVSSCPIPDPCGTSGDAIPWAIKHYKGKLYVGVVCNAINSQLRTDLSAHVYEIDAGCNAKEIIGFPLDYTKGRATGYDCDSDRWYPWVDDWNTITGAIDCGGTERLALKVYPQPVLSDIEFLENGDMVLGFFDRTGFQVGQNNMDVFGSMMSPEGPFGYSAMVGGDILRVEIQDGCVGVLESNGMVDGLTGGSGNGQGPGGGEFYTGDSFTNHDETSLGGLATTFGECELVSTVYDALQFDSGGLEWLSSTNGTSNQGFTVYTSSFGDGSFAKGIGLGDVEIACTELPPFEIGNYVWCDSIVNGIQDACESPIAGMIVELYDNTGALVGATTTNANGNYYFNENTVDIEPSTKYYIVFGNGQFSNDKFTIGADEYGGSTPIANANSDMNDNIDSDVDGTVLSTAIGAMPAGLPFICFTSGETGCGDHTYDMGVLCAVLDAALIKTLNTTLTTIPVQLNQTVTFDIEVCNQGTATIDSLEVTDYIPTGYSFVPNNGWTALGTDAFITLTPGVNGMPTVGLEADECVTLPIELTVTSSDPDDLINYSEITAAQDETGNTDDVDSTPGSNSIDENGIEPGDPDDNNFDGAGPSEGEDEDDHDPATVPIVDVALAKTTITVSPYTYGQVITFNIEVTNQGNVDLEMVEVTDYIPCGFSYSTTNNTMVPAWSMSGTDAVATIPDLDAGQSINLMIDLILNPVEAPCTNDEAYLNFAEVSSMLNDDGTNVSMDDIDSEADADDSNDPGGEPDSDADDFVDGDGTGVIGDGVDTTDEDDHDPELVEIFDLALNKILTTAGPYSYGDDLTFTIEVCNQGNVTAVNTEVTDYIPAGYVYNGGDNMPTGTANSASWTGASPTVTTVIEGPLAGGACASVDIILELGMASTSTDWDNYAEISYSEDEDGNGTDGTGPDGGIIDIDSTPDGTNGNDAGGEPGSDADDYIDGNGTGVIGDGVDTTDEDDHDPAFPEILDIALAKTTLTAGPYTYGQTITFNIEVINQGNVDLENVQVIDYIPCGYTYSTTNNGMVPAWSMSGTDAVATIPDLDAGQSINLMIDLILNPVEAPCTNDEAYLNFAEVSSMLNDDGTNVSMDDIDSEADADDSNDPGGEPDSDADDFVDGDGTGVIGDGVDTTDEDDHDPEKIEIFDLALAKVLTTPTPYAYGDDLTFTIEVTNQGNVTAENIEITDYIPAGYVYNAGDNMPTAGGTTWMGASPTVTTQLIGPLDPGASTTVTIVLELAMSVGDTDWDNYAEISYAEDAEGNATDGTGPDGGIVDVDSTPDGTNGNDAGGEPDSDADNYVDGDGTGVIGDGVDVTDEDDHDPAAPVIVDIALAKTTLTAGPYVYGQEVEFNIEVSNQGNVDLTDIEITDYMPCGFSFGPSNVDFMDMGATSVATIDNLDAAMSTNLSIFFVVNPVSGACPHADAYTNFAEVSEMFGDADMDGTDEDLSMDDIDSEADDTNGNDSGGEPDSDADDFVDGDGTGVIGDGVDSTDEDDHDPERIEIFDLALAKVLTTPTPYAYGDDLTFTIEVTNQGNVTAENIEITDYIPAGYIYNSVDNNPTITTNTTSWVGGSPLVMTLITGPLAPGATISVDIVLELAMSSGETAWDNYAEISYAEDADGNATDGTGPDGGIVDADSTTDGTNGNDAGGQPDSDADNYVDGDGTGVIGDGVDVTDEDDHDPAAPEILDVALIKTTFTPGPYMVGQVVTFEIVVENQGNIDLQNVEVTDYIPCGYTYNAATNDIMMPIWSDNGATATTTIDDLDAGQSVSVFIDFVIELIPGGCDHTTAYTNYAEVSSMQNDDMEDVSMEDIDSDADNDPDDDEGGTPWTDEDDHNMDDSTDTDGDGITDEDDHDPEQIGVPQIGLAKSLVDYSTPASGISGHVTVTMDLVFKNIGNVDLQNIDLIDELDSADNFGMWYYGLELGTVPLITATTATTDPIIDASYDGFIGSNTNIFDGMSGYLEPDQEITVRIMVELDATIPVVPDTLYNQADVFGDFIHPVSMEVVTVDDPSDSGLDPEGSNPDAPGDMLSKNDPTPIPMLGCVGNFVWNDCNGNGVQDSGEEGIEGVVIHLKDITGTTIMSTITDADGLYEFEFIIPGDYYLEFEAPAGLEFTFPDDGGDDTADSDVTGFYGVGTTDLFYVAPGVQCEDNAFYDAGLYECVLIGDLVWYDNDEDNIYDNIENGINGLQVNLYRKNNMTGVFELFDITHTGHKPNTPSDDGWYKFCAAPGTYYVEIGTPLNGLVLAQPNIGNDEEIDSDLDNFYGPNTSDEFTVICGEDQCDLGAGFYLMATAGDRVWRDDNSNGKQDNWEPKVANVLVEVYDNTGTKIDDDITDSNGDYFIDYLQEEDYYFRVVPPAGYGITDPNVGGDDSIDSDITGSNGPQTSDFYTMESGEHQPNIDIGLILGGSLPVDYLEFKGRNNGDHNLIQWTTSNEVNNSHFEVERQLGTGQFIKVGRVEGAGTVSATRDYSFADFDITEPGLYYYRLRQLDYNGNADLSGVTAIVVKDPNRASGIGIYPNPVADELNLELTAGQMSGEITVQIFDTAGKLVMSEKIDAGNSADYIQHSMNMARLSEGVYNMSVQLTNETLHKQFIKVK